LFSSNSFGFAEKEELDCAKVQDGTASVWLIQFCKLEPVKRQDVRNAYNLSRMFREQGLSDLCLEQIGIVKASVHGVDKSVVEIESDCRNMRSRDVSSDESQRSAGIRRVPSSMQKIEVIPVLKKSN
jgi:hypothetical protein